jgi:hypothetical protein
LWRAGASGVAIDLDQHKTAGIVGLLDDIKTGDAWFLNAVTGVFQRSGLECSHAIGFDVNKHMNDEHGFPSP